MYIDINSALIYNIVQKYLPGADLVVVFKTLLLYIEVDLYFSLFFVKVI